MISFPGSKINLGLWVIEKRPDGYHNLETLFYPCPWTDVLEIVPNSKSEDSFHFSGIEIKGRIQDNLIAKGLQLFFQGKERKQFYDVYLNKLVPMGAGLGGGSADAAHTLLLLNKLNGYIFTQEELLEKALQLGSDVPFFIEGKPVYGSGRGEVFQASDISLKGHHILIIWPNFGIGTAEAFSGMKPQKRQTSIQEIAEGNISDWKERLVNDFEVNAFKNHPILKEIKEKLYESGAYYAAMSGSGSTMFGLFNDQALADLANNRMSHYGLSYLGSLT